MILTFTPNPSLDRTALLAGPLVPAGVNHVIRNAWLAGGRGVHVSATVHRAGRPTLAILPVHHEDPLARSLKESGTPYRAIHIPSRARTNVTLVHEDITTLIREAGSMLPPEATTAMVSTVMAASPGATWLALCGSLPPGTPTDLYVRLARAARGVGVRVAVQATGPGLDCVLAHSPADAPDLLVLNARQFRELTGADLPAEFGEDRVVAAAQHVGELLAHGIPRVLVTLGEQGAISAGPDGLWYARTEPVAVVTGVGRGAAALAGYLMSSNDGLDEAGRLARAVAYGTARTGLPGAAAPTPADADAVDVLVSELPA